MMFSLLFAAYLCINTPEVVPVKEEPAEMVITGSESYSYMAKDDIDLMARVVMSEAGDQSLECKEAVATVILNRVASPDYPNRVYDVVHAQNQFSTHDNGAPTHECYTAVYSALIWWGSDNEILPKSIYYFRAGHYHKWALNYRQIDDLYFSAPKTACFD
jgi:spore germination cell wall hydrolase CwlJ-like protein